MNKAAFLDRDGVINKDPPVHDYIKSWIEFAFLPDVFESVRLLKKFGYKTIIITNQGGVSKGLMSLEDVDEIHKQMIRQLKVKDAIIDDIYLCPHKSDDNCYCKKPKPGMIFRAAKEHDIDLSLSYMIGNSEADVLAGMNSGCRTILIDNRNEVANAKPNYVAHSLFDAVKYILAKDK